MCRTGQLLSKLRNRDEVQQAVLKQNPKAAPIGGVEWELNLNRLASELPAYRAGEEAHNEGLPGLDGVSSSAGSSAA